MVNRQAEMQPWQWFRKKPVVVAAWQFDGKRLPILPSEPLSWADGGKLRVATLEGDMFVSPGDWIIRGVKGELYPCKPDIFEATYEREEHGR